MRSSINAIPFSYFHRDLDFSEIDPERSFRLAFLPKVHLGHVSPLSLSPYVDGKVPLGFFNLTPPTAASKLSAPFPFSSLMSVSAAMALQSCSLSTDPGNFFLFLADAGDSDSPFFFFAPRFPRSLRFSFKGTFLI